MNFLPICIRIADRKVLIVGGGKIALQKLQTLLLYTRDVLVRAPEVAPEIALSGIAIDGQPYGSECLEGIGLVFACTNDPAVNRRVVCDARARGILVCSADDPEACDFVSPAIFKEGHMSIAVSSDARDVKKAISWRNSIRRLLLGSDSNRRWETINRI